MRRTEARVYLAPEAEEDRYLPEGPRWMTVAGRPALAWVNIALGATDPEGELHVHFPDSDGTEDGQRACPGRPGFLLPIRGGNKALVGVEKDVRICDLAEGLWSDPLATIPDDNPRTIINDAEIVPGGRAVVFGTKDTRFAEPLAALYLYTASDDAVSLLATGQLCSNGKVFATDDRGIVLFDIDTPTRKVVRYRLNLEARSIAPDGVALELSAEVGFPDGMCDCGDGTVIVAFYNPEFAEAGRAVRYDLRTGAALEEWLTPGSPRVTCPLLVTRPSGVKLILTTAVEGMPAELRAKCPNAGCLFVADTQFERCPPHAELELE